MTAPQTRAVASVRDPLAFLSADTEVVIAADLGRLKRSALWRHVEPIVYGQVGDDLMRFRELCGYDPLSSMTRVTLGLRSLGAPRSTGVFVLRGVERAPLLACLRKHLVPVRGEVAVIEGEDPVALAFASDDTLVILVGPGASPAALTRLLEGGAPLRSSPAFLDLFAGIDASHELWFLLNSKNAFARLAELGVTTRALSGSISAHPGIHATVRMRVGSSDQAREVAEVLRVAFRGLAQEVDFLEIATDHADVVGRIKLTDEQLAQLGVEAR